MKTSPAALSLVQCGVCTAEEDNGCKHLRNGNEVSIVSLPEYTCIFVRRRTVQLASQGKDLTMERLKSSSPESESTKRLSRQF